MFGLKRIRQKMNNLLCCKKKKKAVGNHCLLVPDTSSIGLLGGCALLAGGLRAADLSVLALKVGSLQNNTLYPKFVGMNSAWNCKILPQNTDCSNSQTIQGAVSAEDNHYHIHESPTEESTHPMAFSVLCGEGRGFSIGK